MLEKGDRRRTVVSESDDWGKNGETNGVKRANIVIIWFSVWGKNSFSLKEKQKKILKTTPRVKVEAIEEMCGS